MEKFSRLAHATGLLVTSLLAGCSPGAAPRSPAAEAAPASVASTAEAPPDDPQPGQGDWCILRRTGPNTYLPIGVWIEYRSPPNNNAPDVDTLWIVHKGAVLPANTDLKLEKFEFTPASGSKCSSKGEVQAGSSTDQDACAQEVFNTWKTLYSNFDLGNAPIQHKLEQSVKALGW